MEIATEKELLHLAGVVGLVSVVNATMVKKISSWAEENMVSEC